MREGRSNFTDRRNDRQEYSAGKGSDTNAEQFRILNAKLDAILKALS